MPHVVIVAGPGDHWATNGSIFFKEASEDRQAPPIFENVEQIPDEPKPDLIIIADSVIKPIEMIGAALRKFGPVRVVLVMKNEDFELLGSALRAQAVDARLKPANRDEALKLVQSARDRDPPDEDSIDFRWGDWRQER